LYLNIEKGSTEAVKIRRFWPVLWNRYV